MKKLTLAVCTALSLACFTACNNDPNPNQPDATDVADDRNDAKFNNTRLEDDAEWAAKAAEGGMVEVQFGKLAQANGASPAVKDFGSMMEKDHSKANDELKALAQKKNITLPVAMSDDHQRKYDDLAKKTGVDFDKAYMDMMIDDHKDDIEDFQDQAKNGKDRELADWAAGVLPTLQHHLDAAQTIRDGLK